MSGEVPSCCWCWHSESPIVLVCQTCRLPGVTQLNQNGSKASEVPQVLKEVLFALLDAALFVG